MRDKTAYRPKPETPEAVIAAPAEGPAVAVDIRPASESAETQPEAAREYEKEATKADEAAEALRRQVDALRMSEQLNRQQAEHVARLQQWQSLTPAQKLDQWRQQGMADADYEFLVANPELVANDQLACMAANEAARRGFERGTEPFREATKQLFHEHLQAQAQQQTQTEPAAMRENDFFKPPPPKPVRPQSVPVSAPVSRTIPDGGPRPDFEQDPRRVNLSVEERGIAKASGISETEYARQKIRMMQAKQRGEIV
jgi:hypothetical protein